MKTKFQIGDIVESTAFLDGFITILQIKNNQYGFWLDYDGKGSMYFCDIGRIDGMSTLVGRDVWLDFQEKVWLDFQEKIKDRMS